MLLPSYVTFVQLGDIVEAVTNAMAQGSLSNCYLLGNHLIRRELVATLLIAQKADVLTAL